MKLVANTALLLAISLIVMCFLASCNPRMEVAELQPFSDNIVKTQLTTRYVIALGGKGIYVLAGRYNVFGRTAGAGTLVGYTSDSHFKIKDVAAQLPQLKSRLLDKAIAEQDREIEHEQRQKQKNSG